MLMSHSSTHRSHDVTTSATPDRDPANTPKHSRVPSARRRSIEDWRAMYNKFGLTSIPLHAGTKRPLDDAWHRRPPTFQWALAEDQTGGTLDVNIGLITGEMATCDGLAVLDCDDQRSQENAKRVMHALNVRPACVRSPHGLHYYLRVRGVPSNLGMKVLASDFGRGEFRYSNVVVAAPCSVVDGHQYEFVRGHPAVLTRQRAIHWRDIQEHIPFAGNSASDLDDMPLRLVRRPVPERADALLHALSDWPKHRPVHIQHTYDWFPSRSEAEASIVCQLLLAGYCYDEISSLFEEFRPTHYARKSEEGGDRYLRHTYRNAVNWLASQGDRPHIAASYEAAFWAEWPGSGGLMERDVYLGLLAIAWQCASWEVYAGYRDLAAYASTEVATVGKAVRRLQQKGLVERLGKGNNTLRTQALRASHWRVKEFSDITEDRGSGGRAQTADSTPPESIMSVVDGVESPALDEGQREVLASITEVVGRAASVMYQWMLVLDAPATVHLLQRLTGKSRGTVTSACNALRHYGLALRTEEGWVCGSRAAEQDVVARAEGHRETRCERFREEQREWSETLAFRRALSSPAGEGLENKDPDADSADEEAA
jgi:hypothetical protein